MEVAMVICWELCACCASRHLAHGAPDVPGVPGLCRLCLVYKVRRRVGQCASCTLAEGDSSLDIALDLRLDGLGSSRIIDLPIFLEQSATHDAAHACSA